MSGNCVSKFGKKVGVEMSTTIALDEACQWHDALMDAEFNGRNDKESAARFRLSKKIGVPESYLYRLAYKRREMRDMSAEIYRRLKQGYVGACEANKKAAAEYRAQRLSLEQQYDDFDLVAHTKSVGIHASSDAAKEE